MLLMLCEFLLNDGKSLLDQDLVGGDGKDGETEGIIDQIESNRITES